MRRRRLSLQPSALPENWKTAGVCSRRAKGIGRTASGEPEGFGGSSACIGIRHGQRGRRPAQHPHPRSRQSQESGGGNSARHAAGGFKRFPGADYRRQWTASTRPLAGKLRKSPDRPCDGEPHLEASLRPGTGPNGGQLRQDGRAAHSSRVAGLSARRFVESGWS